MTKTEEEQMKMRYQDWLEENGLWLVEFWECEIAWKAWEAAWATRSEYGI